MHVDSSRSTVGQEEAGDESIATRVSALFEAEGVEYTCEKCGCKTHTRSRKIATLPRLLVVPLNRFAKPEQNEEEEAVSKVCPST